MAAGSARRWRSRRSGAGLLAAADNAAAAAALLRAADAACAWCSPCASPGTLYLLLKQQREGPTAAQTCSRPCRGPRRRCRRPGRPLAAATLPHSLHPRSRLAARIHGSLFHHGPAPQRCRHRHLNAGALRLRRPLACRSTARRGARGRQRVRVDGRQLVAGHPRVAMHLGVVRAQRGSQRHLQRPGLVRRRARRRGGGQGTRLRGGGQARLWRGLLRAPYGLNISSIGV